MSLPRISLQALDAFERVAQSGSVQVAASEMALSISSVSHHIARLEQQLNVILFDRSTRPFTLTREGEQALQHMSKGLFHIRRATHETTFRGLLRTTSLRIGIVEEFESTVTPDLAAFLAKQMPRTSLSITNILSHDAPKLLQKDRIDLAVVSKPDTSGHTTMSEVLLRDPFVIAIPAHRDVDPNALVQGTDELAFLRFNQTHLIGKQIEAHLKRNSIDLPHRFALDSVQSIMAIIAGGTGWSIVTPLGYMRAQRFAANVKLCPLPIPSFARKIDLVTRDDFDATTRDALATLLRQIIAREVVTPACDVYPWLSDSLTLEI